MGRLRRALELRLQPAAMLKMERQLRENPPARYPRSLRRARGQRLRCHSRICPQRARPIALWASTAILGGLPSLGMNVELVSRVERVAAMMGLLPAETLLPPCAYDIGAEPH